MPHLDLDNKSFSIMKVFKILKLLPSRYFRHFFTVLTLTTIVAILEMFGVGLVVPFIGIISNPNIVNENELFSQFNNFLGNPSYEFLLLYASLIFAGFFLFKNIFIGFTNWVIAHYIFKVKAHMGIMLFKKYLFLPNIDRQNFHSSLLIRNITAETQFYAMNGILPLIHIISESTIFLGIGILLFWFSPVSAIAAALVISFSMLAFQLIIRKRIQLWSITRATYEGLRFKTIQEAISISKEISLLGRQLFFLNKFYDINLVAAKIERNNFSISQIPRLWLETLGVLALMSLVFTTLINNSSSTNLIGVMSLYAAAIFKLLPSANRIITSFQNLKFGEASLDVLSKELKGDYFNQPNDKATILFKRSIEFRNVSFTYPGADKAVIRNVSLVIQKGERIGIVGESGSGKSTFVDLLLGLLKPTSGEILVDDINIKDGLRSWQDQIGYVPQDIYLIDESLKHNIALGVDPEEIAYEAIERSIRDSQISNFLDSLPNGLDSILGERGDKLSGGQKQRIGIARALYNNPCLLVLDEATSALDTATEIKIINSLEKLNQEKTLVVIAHRLTTIENCNKVIQIKNGNIEIIRQ